MRPDGTPVYASSVVREEKAAARTKKQRQKPIVKRRKAIARGVAPEVARAQTPLRPAPSTRRTVRRAPVDPIDLVNQTYLESKRREERRTRPSREVQTGGLPDRLQLLRNDSPDSFFGGLVKNTARGALDMATGLPAAAQLLGENAAAFNTLVGPLRFVPGLDAVDRYQDRVARTDKRAGTALAESYKYKYGPAFRGDFGTTAERIYEDPLGTALDVSGAYGLAGRAGNVGSKLGRALAPNSAMAARASRRLSIAPAGERETFVAAENAARRAAGKKPIPFQPGPGGRHRAPKVYRSEANAKGGRTATAEAVVDRSPYSANAITRGVQRRLDRVRPRVQGRVERFATGTGRATSLRAAAERFTQQRRFDKHQGNAAREIRYMAERRTEAMIASTPEYHQFVKATRRLQKDKTPAGIAAKGLGQEELAVSLHLDDIVSPRAGMSAVQLRDRAVANWERELAKFDGPKQNAQLQIERIKQIPEEYLTLAGGSPAVQRIKTAVQAGRDLDRVSQNRSVAAGVVTRETADAAKSRPSAVILGEAEWMPSMLKRVKDEGVGKIGRREAVIRDFEANPPRGWHEARAAVQEAENDVRMAREASPVKLMAATRKLDKAKSRLKRIEERGKQRIAQPARPELVPGLPPVKQGHIRLWRAEPRKFSGWADKTNHPDVPANQRGRWFTPTKKYAETFGDDLKYVDVPRSEVEKYRTFGESGGHVFDDFGEYLLPDELLKQARPVGKSRAVYRPAVTSEPARKGALFRPSRGMSGPQKVKQSHGTLQRTGTYDMNPALLAHQARRAAGNVTGPMSSRALDELIDTAAYKLPGKDGTQALAKGKRAYQMMANSPDKVVLVNAQSLKKALAKLDRLEEGKFLDDVDVQMFYGKPGKGQDWLRDLEESKVSNQYVAISRSAAEAWRESMAAPWKWLEKYDNALDLWKGGLLALSPRWYTTNVVGLAFQYGIVAGGDVRSIFRAARSKEIKRAIAGKNPDVAVATLADELTSGIDAAKIENAGAVMSTIRRGFKINNGIEAMWRRAAYLNRSKKMLRDEGGRFRGMSDKELAAAIDRMPESVARQVVKDVDFYIGEYGRYNSLERQFIKRVVPFYSWLRVIGRLTLGLPFKSPVRALAMATLSKAATAGLNPNDYQLPAYARGSFSIGDVKVPTWSLNPFQTVVPFLEGAGEANAFGGLAKAGTGWMTPIAQFGLNQGFGLNNFGEGVFAPPGASGTVQQYGRDPQEMNAATGLPMNTKVRIPWSEAFIQTAVPGIAGPLRRALVGEETAFDTTTLPDLLGLTGKPRSEMFYQRKGKRSRQPTLLNPFTSYFGVPTYRQNDRIVEQQYRKALREFEDARRQTARRKRKAS